jgi:hypothetical protein
MEKKFTLSTKNGPFDRTVNTNAVLWSPMKIWDHLWGGIIPPACNPGKSKLLEVSSNRHVWSCNDYMVERSDIHRTDPANAPLVPYRFLDCNQRWEAADKEFEVIVSVDVIEHIENPWHFVREAVRCSSRYVIIMTPNVETDLSAKLFLQKRYLHQFTPFDQQQSQHITPVFKWQFQKMSSINRCSVEFWEDDFLEWSDEPMATKGIIQLGGKDLLLNDKKYQTGHRRIVRFTRQPLDKI